MSAETQPHIAIVGSGISGLTSAWLLRNVAKVTVFERDADHLGGHTDTHNVKINNQSLSVDTGFIVFNRRNYPHFCHMIDALGVKSQASDMSLAIDNRLSGLTYNPSKGHSLLYRSRNFLKPRFWRLIKDLLRFYRQAKTIDRQEISFDTSIDAYLEANHYSAAFRDEHLYPMCGALWSVASSDVGSLPLKFLLGFMQNHRMLELKDRPQWLTVQGGSARYVDALKAQLTNTTWQHDAVTQVTRSEQGVNITTAAKPEIVQHFDAVIMACHGPQSHALLTDKSAIETEILSAYKVSQNYMVLHTDASILPNQKRLWASWNVSVDASVRHTNNKHESSQLQQPQPAYGIHYWMNNLQNLDSDVPIIASLNPQRPIESDKVLVRRDYAHPLYDADTLRAQSRWSELCEGRRTYFVGAYWGWGFHEDGAASAFRAVNQLGKDLGLSAELAAELEVDTQGLVGAVC